MAHRHAERHSTLLAELNANQVLRIGLTGKGGGPGAISGALVTLFLALNTGSMAKQFIICDLSVEAAGLPGLPSSPESGEDALVCGVQQVYGGNTGSRALSNRPPAPRASTQAPLSGAEGTNPRKRLSHNCRRHQDVFWPE